MGGGGRELCLSSPSPPRLGETGWLETQPFPMGGQPFLKAQQRRLSLISFSWGQSFLSALAPEASFPPPTLHLKPKRLVLAFPHERVPVLLEAKLTYWGVVEVPLRLGPWCPQPRYHAEPPADSTLQFSSPIPAPSSRLLGSQVSFVNRLFLRPPQSQLWWVVNMFLSQQRFVPCWTCVHLSLRYIVASSLLHFAPLLFWTSVTPNVFVECPMMLYKWGWCCWKADGKLCACVWGRGGSCGQGSSL